MGRNVKIRASYDNDMQFMLRLKKAVEEDYARDKDWRGEVMGALQGVIELLVAAPEPNR